jgi:hypothetical protein
VRSRTGLVILVSFVLVTAVACTSDRPSRPSPAVAPVTTVAAHHAAPSAAAPAAGATPQELRGQFEQLLGQHALLAVRLTRSEVSKTQDFRQVAEASLEENTNALSQLVSSAYSGSDGGRFKQLWQGYVTSIATYAEAATSKDAAAKQAARADLKEYCDDWGAWLAQASNGQVEAAKAEATATARIEELVRQVDAYAAGDYDRAYQTGRQAYQKTFTAGGTLAKASLSGKAAAGLDAAPEQLRSAFAMLLGEHMELVIDAQRASFAGSEEFQAAAAQVNANTSTLAEAMGAIVGPAKAAEFESAWANHVEGLMAYAAAVAAKDEAAKKTALENLRGFGARLALYFSDIVNNRLPVDALSEALSVHDKHLLEQIDAYAANDYGKSQQLQLAGYEQMLGVANTLVGAIQRTVEAKMPVGGSQTGGGGTAHQRR